ncbi:MAG: aquaporin [Thermoleophilia bacterium]|nr:aquaporin [Thermoleophilia bacterium]
MTTVHSLGSKLLAEFIGTFFLIAAGLGVFLNTGDLLATAFAHGLAIAIGVTAIGHVSGGHLNPAVTSAMLVFRQISLVEAIAYVVAQLSGAYVAALCIMWGWDTDGSGLTGATPALAAGLGVGNGILLELIATFLLVWTVFAVAVDRDGAFFKVAGLPIGFAVTTGILMIGGATGAALNPARWFGPALLTGTWNDAVVWIVGPIAGGILAGAAYLYGVKPRLAGAAAAPDTV